MTKKSKPKSTTIFTTDIDDINAIDNLSNIISDTFDKLPIIVCIGTDRLIKDSIGPITGTILSKYFPNNIFGTLENPVHAKNVTEFNDTTLKEYSTKHPDLNILAIDAALTEDYDTFTIKFKHCPISPGKALNKELPDIGDYSISAIVDNVNIDILSNNIRLFYIYKLSNIIAQAIIKSFN